MLERALGSMRSMRAAIRRNSGVGRRSSVGMRCGRKGCDLRRCDAGAVQQPERFALQCREALPVATLHQLRAQGQAGQSVDGVVQVQQQLAPLHGTQVGVQLQRQAGTLEGG